MKNYKNNHYALNKYSGGIVYQFTDRTVTVTLADYLASDPNKTEDDFWELKRLSDEMYLHQVRAENAQTKKNVSLHSLEETRKVAGSSLEDEYIEISDKKLTIEAVRLLFSKGGLTEIQKRRFILFFIKGLSLRKIAELENVHYMSISDSINLATEKLKNLFEKI